ncbi:MAG: hypothetical protein COC08_03330 [Maribacter sp.]|nr:MAG: hypothetical protein COC08_03330 [Maribacter sp.]
MEQNGYIKHCYYILYYHREPSRFIKDKLVRDSGLIYGILPQLLFQTMKSTTSTQACLTARQGYVVCFRKNVFHFEASPPDVMGRPRGTCPLAGGLNPQ